MKNLIGFLCGFIVLAAVVIATKPSDQACIEQATAHYAGNSVGEILGGAGGLVLKVDDKIFYKVITNRFTGEQVGLGALCTVFYN